MSFRRSATGWLMVAAAVCVPPSLAGADEVTLAAIRDATLFQDEEGDTASGSGPALFAGMNSQRNIRRTLVRFDPRTAIPQGARITSVELRLTVLGAPNTTPRAMTLHRVAADWGEGESSSEGGLGDAATPGDATWIHAFHPDRSWSVPGGDYEAVASATASVPPEGTVVWSGSGLVEDLSEWVEGPASNFGWLLRGEEEEPASARRFASRESSRASERPTLVVVFTPPEGLRSSTWGREKARWRTPRPGG